MHNPSHPGRILQTELEGRDLEEFARSLGITLGELVVIMCGRAPISEELSHRLAAALHTSPDFWYRLQVNYDGSQAH